MSGVSVVRGVMVVVIGRRMVSIIVGGVLCCGVWLFLGWYSYCGRSGSL